MAIKISVIGPKDLVDKIIDEGTSYSNFILTACAYENVTETLQIINKCINQTDLILFAGETPYYIARKNIEKDIPMLYVSYSPTAFYKSMFNYLESENWSYSKTLKFSIDSVDRKVVEDMLEELGITDYEVFVKESENSYSSESIVDYHNKLFKEGKTDFMITPLTSAYEGMIQLGMPACRIVPTVMSIRETLKMANLEAQNMLSKKAQLCIGVMKVINWDDLDNYAPSKYEQHRMKLTMMEAFINFCESIKASMEFKDDDEYMFYATRGVIESITNNYSYMPIIQNITDQLPFKICIGLGYGFFANEAKKNSRDALEYAINHNKNCCYVIMEDGKVRGPLQGGRVIEFYSSAKEAKVSELVKKSNVSAVAINKILGIIDSYGRDTLSSIEIAETLNITLRSARRILNNMEEAGIAKVIGEEQPVGRGRPRQIYKIML